MPDTTRCFVALDLPAPLKAKIADLIQSLSQLPDGDRLKWARLDGLHLTLKFLGDVPNSQLAAIQHSCQEVAASASSFELSTEGIGVFPRLEAPRIVWLGLGGAIAALKTLQRQVETALAALGFAPEERPFSPHLTLARVPDIGPAAKRELGQRLQTFSGSTSLGSFTAHRLTLMQSQLDPAGAIYTPLQNFDFKIL